MLIEPAGRPALAVVAPIIGREAILEIAFALAGRSPADTKHAAARLVVDLAEATAAINPARARMARGLAVAAVQSALDVLAVGSLPQAVR